MVAACAAGGVAFATPCMIVPFTPIICDEGSTGRVLPGHRYQGPPAARATAQQADGLQLSSEMKYWSSEILVQ
ncbi:hypothetical protein FQZ97_794900 [compost metagenome]